MNLMIRSLLITALAPIAMPAAADNVAATDSGLERKVFDLERRVSELEASLKVNPAAVSQPLAMGNWEDLKNWRQLRTGMTYDEVRRLLGEPENIKGGAVAYWYWGGRSAHAIFMKDALYSWSEPN